MSRLTQPSQVRRILESIGVQPSKVLGQNFLIDGNILGIILEAARLQPEDVVLEIGPGLGSVTEALLPRVRRLIAVEKDRRLCAWLRESLGGHAHLELIEGDALDLDLGALLGSGVNKIVSNLPYSVGSRILHEVFQSPFRPRSMVVMHQLDVARRLVAEPGSEDYGVLSVWGQMFYDIGIHKVIRAPCYYPAPKITSALIAFHRRLRPLVELRDAALFGRLVKGAFGQRRKQMGGLLRSGVDGVGWPEERVGAWLAELGAGLRTRPEELSPEQWGRLANRIAAAI